MLWLNSKAITGIFAGLPLLVAATRLPNPLISWYAAFAGLACLGLAQEMLNSGTLSSTMRLYHWQEGHLLSYNSFSQVILLLFPLLMLGYLWRMRSR